MIALHTGIAIVAIISFVAGAVLIIAGALSGA